jgi:ceramide glucosyltransferase
MPPALQLASVWLGTALAAVALAYAITAWVASSRWRAAAAQRDERAWAVTSAPAAVTVLKPLCGIEPGTYECLRSFCTQRYPCLQIVFGVRDALDPAVPVVRRLQQEFPALQLELVIDGRQHGSSLKVSNLINMMARARHDHLVVSDSDVRVTPDYLSGVIPELAQSGVGLVTCAYRGRPCGGPWSLLLALFINDWFMPSVFVSASLGSQAFVSGATIALRRATLDAIGGFAAIADQLADDYMLGELTRRLGLRTVLSRVRVETDISEPQLADLVRHELRWLRTIRAVRPAGYACSFVTFPLPVAALGCLLAGLSAGSLLLLALTGIVRVMLHFANRGADSALIQLMVLPFNDLLAFSLWCWGFASRRVHWRQRRYRVARDGSVQPLP